MWFSIRMFTESLARRTLRGQVHGRIVAVDRSATGSVALTIEANGNWAGFRAGQYTQLSVEIDGVRQTRCYSMSSAAGTTRTFQLGIKAQPEGLVSQYLVAHAAPGLVVGLTPAAGEFHLPDARPGRVLLISGGSGITPVLSMLRTLCAEGHDGEVTFLHFNGTPDAVIARDEIDALASAHPSVRVVFAYDRFTKAHLDAADPRWREAETFVCGPTPLMDLVRAEYESAGVAERFHQEAFTLAAFVGEAGDIGGSVRFAASALEVASDGRTLLEQAEAAGLSPQAGCRMGICHTCPRQLTSGTVRNAVTGELTCDSGVDVQICVSVPVGDVAIDL
jgi:stearoyl-CoA 9-desaturase NADPH oxidoreductase